MLKLTLRTRPFAATTAMRTFAERRAQSALAPHSARVRSAVLRVQDINGPRGGNDIRCVLSVEGAGLKRVVVQATDASFYSAVDRVMRKAKEAFDRAIRRQQSSWTAKMTFGDVALTGIPPELGGTP